MCWELIFFPRGTLMMVVVFCVVSNSCEKKSDDKIERYDKNCCGLIGVTGLVNINTRGRSHFTFLFVYFTYEYLMFPCLTWRWHFDVVSYVFVVSKSSLALCVAWPLSPLRCARYFRTISSVKCSFACVCAKQCHISCPSGSAISFFQCVT